MVSCGERPGESGAPQLTSVLLLYFSLVSLTFTAPSSEWGTSWYSNTNLLRLLPWFSALLVPRIPFPWPDAMGPMHPTTPAPERSIMLA